MIEEEMVNQFKDELLKKKSRLEQELSGFADETNREGKGDFDSKWPEYGTAEEDNALEVADYSDRVGLEFALETDLRQVNNALERMDQGKYGICEFCGQEIPEARLKVYPEATACVKCEEKRMM